MDADIALAADKVILSTEQIVDNDQIPPSADRTFISFLCVDAVVEVPFGSMPHEWLRHFIEPAFSHIDAYCKRIAADGAEGAKAYLKTHCYSLNAWEDFLEKIGDLRPSWPPPRPGAEVDHG